MLLALLILSAALSEEQAKAIVPRADLSGMTDTQRGDFVAVAHDVFNYAGCQDTLEKCLGKDQKDPHAVRMATLLKQALIDGLPGNAAVQLLEQYYASFEQKTRQKFKTDSCPTLGKGPVTLVEFSDYQCPHCAAAVEPLHDLVTKDAAGKVRLCAKYFPFPAHPRARIAALCAEYARAHGKFWEMHTTLFAHQDALEDPNLKEYAQSLGLNGDEMLKQAYAGKFDDAVEKNIREGTIAGLDHTPMIYVNGRSLLLPPRPFYLKFTVDDELEWSKKHAWVFEKTKAKHT